MGTIRRLNDVLRELELLTEQGRAVGFFNNVENADKLAGLVEGVRDAVMDYQVRKNNNYLIFPCVISIPDSVATRHIRQELPTHRENPFLIVQLL